MDNSLIANAITTVLSSFLSNSGEEIAKNAGKDIYKKIKLLFKKEEEKDILNDFETAPFSIDYRHSLEKILVTNLSDPNFFKETIHTLHITPANTFIIELVLSSIRDIKAELPQLYRWWRNASPDKKGEYENRIEQLEVQLIHLEKKLLLTIHSV
ncbi:MAG TPA: hypothetical protein VF939_09495 [Puia sp.]